MAPAPSLTRAAPVRLLKAVVRWAPVWAPLVLIWQLTEGGLKPALAEQRRLHREEPAVRERNARTKAEFERLTAQREAWEDPLFLERVRREKARAAKPTPSGPDDPSEPFSAESSGSEKTR